MRNIQITNLEKYADQSAYEKVEDGVYKILSGDRAGRFAMAYSFKHELFSRAEGADEKALEEFSDKHGSFSLEFQKGSSDERTGTVEVVSKSLEDLAKWRTAALGKRIYLKDAEEVWADSGYTDDDGKWVAEDRKPIIHGWLTVEDDVPTEIEALLDKQNEDKKQ